MLHMAAMLTAQSHNVGARRDMAVQDSQPATCRPIADLVSFLFPTWPIVQVGRFCGHLRLLCRASSSASDLASYEGAWC